MGSNTLGSNRRVTLRNTFPLWWGYQTNYKGRVSRIAELKQAHEAFAETFDPAINQGPAKEEKENIFNLINTAHKVLGGK